MYYFQPVILDWPELRAGRFSKTVSRGKEAFSPWASRSILWITTSYVIDCLVQKWLLGELRIFSGQNTLATQNDDSFSKVAPSLFKNVLSVKHFLWKAALNRVLGPAVMSWISLLLLIFSILIKAIHVVWNNFERYHLQRAHYKALDVNYCAVAFYRYQYVSNLRKYIQDVR